MRIIGTQYTLATKSLEVYVAGCKGDRHGRHCAGCHNPESWDFELGEPYRDAMLNNILPKLWEFGSMIQNIMIFGGEPLDQDEVELITMLSYLSGFDVKLWLFTRYELHEVPESVKAICAYIKCGAHIPALKTDNNIQCGIKLATSNQRIYRRGIHF